MQTLYEKWLTLTDEVEKMKFFFKNSIRYKNSKLRVSSKKDGIYVTERYNKYFAEYSKIGTEFIHLYKVENGKIGECCGEIIIDNFIENLKEYHSLLKWGLF